MAEAILRRSAAVESLVVVQRLVGMLLILFTLTMLPALGVDLYYQDGASPGFLYAMIVTLSAGLLIWGPVRHRTRELKVGDGFLALTAFWVVLGLFGALPFLFVERPAVSITDAVFESVSGLTTTGATALIGLDTLPHAVLFWRAQLQWMGGMGVIVMAVAILPLLGVGGMQLYRAETPGPMKNTKLTPRIQDTARALWLIYVALTLACAAAYWLAGMNVFDAVCHAFTTLSTGGYSTHDLSMGYFDSSLIELVAVVFMILGGINFALHFTMWRRTDLGVYLRDPEAVTFLMLVVVVTLVVGGYLFASGTYAGVVESVMAALFQVVSIGTSTGYTTADFSIWPSFIPMTLILGSFVGGCAGSTAGGIKVVRCILLFKQGVREVYRVIHPHAEIGVKLAKRRVAPQVINAVWSFFTVYVGLFALMFLALLATGLDEVTAVTAVAASINNLGPGLGEMAANVTGINDTAKWVMMAAMVLGRLEIFTVLVILSPMFWRR